MSSYSLNPAAVAHARRLIDTRQYLRRLHRAALIALVYRASQWRHKEIELAAHDLLQHLDAVSAR